MSSARSKNGVLSRPSKLSERFLPSSKGMELGACRCDRSAPLLYDKVNDNIIELCCCVCCVQSIHGSNLPPGVYWEKDSQA